MSDFRLELATVIDGLVAEGHNPLFLMVDLVGAESLRHTGDAESLPKFRETCMASLSAAANNAETFSYGDLRIVAILLGFDRLKTFALIDKMRRMLPLLAQSFDCILTPDFDTIELDERTGVQGIISQLAAPRRHFEAA